MEAKRAHGHFYIDRAGTCQTDKLLDESNRLTTSGEKCTAAQTTNIRKGVELVGSPRIKGEGKEKRNSLDMSGARELLDHPKSEGKYRTIVTANTTREREK